MLANYLFVFGDDFKAVLGILEKDEALEEEFPDIAGDVTLKTALFGLYSGCIKVQLAKQQVMCSPINSVGPFHFLSLPPLLKAFFFLVGGGFRVWH